MKEINIEQGTREWLAWRADKYTGSNAPKVMDDSPYIKRFNYLSEVLTGATKPVSKTTQQIFEKGHAAEAAARPIVEDILSKTEGTAMTLKPACVEMDPRSWPYDTEMKEEIYTALNGKMAASLDGLSQDGKIVFEHKLYNKKLVEAINEGVLPGHIIWQLEHNMLVTGATRSVFVTSDGTPHNMSLMWYDADRLAQAALIRGWFQFQKDLKTHEPVEVVAECAEPEWVEIESKLDGIEDQIQSLTELKKQLREKAEAFCNGRKILGARWSGASQKTKGSVQWAQVVKAEAPDADLEGYRAPDKEVFVLRRNKK